MRIESGVWGEEGAEEARLARSVGLGKRAALERAGGGRAHARSGGRAQARLAVMMQPGPAGPAVAAAGMGAEGGGMEAGTSGIVESAQQMSIEAIMRAKLAEATKILRLALAPPPVDTTVEAREEGELAGAPDHKFTTDASVNGESAPVRTHSSRDPRAEMQRQRLPREQSGSASQAPQQPGPEYGMSHAQPAPEEHAPAAPPVSMGVRPPALEQQWQPPQPPSAVAAAVAQWQRPSDAPAVNYASPAGHSDGPPSVISRRLEIYPPKAKGVLVGSKGIVIKQMQRTYNVACEANTHIKYFYIRGRLADVESYITEAEKLLRRARGGPHIVEIVDVDSASLEPLSQPHAGAIEHAEPDLGGGAGAGAGEHGDERVSRRLIVEPNKLMGLVMGKKMARKIDIEQIYSVRIDGMKDGLCVTGSAKSVEKCLEHVCHVVAKAKGRAHEVRLDGQEGERDRPRWSRSPERERHAGWSSERRGREDDRRHQEHCKGYHKHERARRPRSRSPDRRRHSRRSRSRSPDHRHDGRRTYGSAKRSPERRHRDHGRRSRSRSPDVKPMDRERDRSHRASGGTVQSTAAAAAMPSHGEHPLHRWFAQRVTSDTAIVYQGDDGQDVSADLGSLLAAKEVRDEAGELIFEMPQEKLFYLAVVAGDGASVCRDTSSGLAYKDMYSNFQELTRAQR